MKTPVIYFVLPCYNEEECLKNTYDRLNKKYDTLIADSLIDKKSRIVFVDDGSKDKTWQIIGKLASLNENTVGIKLAHNVGHQSALLAGLLFSKDYSDATISMDADLQDNLNVVDGFMKAYNDGNEIVYGVRGSRKTDTAFKRGTAQVFYKIMRSLGVDLVYNAADCRLMSKKALEQLAEYPEVNLFLRGLVPLIGLNSTTVEYERDKRIAGESKYPLKKMISFAWDGVTSFSVKPIRLVLGLGVLVSILSFVVMIYALVRWAIGQTVDGWAFTICSIWLVAGIQMISLGLIGEYIGKIYAETKRRPRYFIEKVIK
ncbi:glycosyltransferase family 2 protein [Candidatus Saccharibacteria bacterium]|nr:glycosyltransferase family 2 protein [Candidatus Saccharibacteria bacterium]